MDQQIVNRLETWIDQHFDEIVSDIKRLVRIPSVATYDEEGTPFGRQHMERFCPDEERSADLYLFAVNELKQRGFEQYEISNFAKDGKYSRHNTRYWDCSEYLGIGPAAHSFWQGERRCFARDLDGFTAAENPWNLWIYDDKYF